MGKITASTRACLVIGKPVRHSLSPVIHNAAFEELGEDRLYFALETGSEGIPALFELLRDSDGIDGVSVTTPCKQAAAENVDVLTRQARRLGAVNTVKASDGELLGANTDGEGLVAALDELGVPARGKRVLILGSGAAARAAGLALAEAGVADLGVMARRRPAAEDLARLVGRPARVVERPDLSVFDVVVNATVVGMRGGPAPSEVPFDLEGFGDTHLVFDMVYEPLETPLMKRAKASGSLVSNGVPMLVHQAGAQIRLWLDREPPLERMRAAALEELKARAARELPQVG